MNALTADQIRNRAVNAAAEVIFSHRPATELDGPVTCTCGQTFVAAFERQHHVAELALDAAHAVLNADPDTGEIPNDD